MTQSVLNAFTALLATMTMRFFLQKLAQIAMIASRA